MSLLMGLTEADMERLSINEDDASHRGTLLITSPAPPPPPLDPALLARFFTPSQSEVIAIRAHMVYADSLLQDVFERIAHAEELYHSSFEFWDGPSDLDIRGLYVQAWELERLKAIDESFLAPIRRLPPEILAEIFIDDAAQTWLATTPVEIDLTNSLTKGDYWERLTVERLLRVCKLWRNVAMHSPPVWTFVDLDRLCKRQPDAISRVLPVRDCPYLALRGDLSRSYGLEPSPLGQRSFLSTLEGHLAHLTHLVLHIPDKKESEDLLGIEARVILPSLICMEFLVQRKIGLSNHAFHLRFGGARFRPKLVIETSRLRNLRVSEWGMVTMLSLKHPLDRLTVHFYTLGSHPELQDALDAMNPRVLHIPMNYWRHTAVEFQSASFIAPSRMTCLYVAATGGSDQPDVLFDFRRANMARFVLQGLVASPRGYHPTLSLIRPIDMAVNPLRILYLTDVAFGPVHDVRAALSQFHLLESLTLELRSKSRPGGTNHALSSVYAALHIETNKPTLDAMAVDVHADAESNSKTCGAEQTIRPNLRQIITKTRVWPDETTVVFLQFVKSRCGPASEYGVQPLAYVRLCLNIVHWEWNRPDIALLRSTLDELLEQTNVVDDRSDLCWINPSVFNSEGFVRYEGPYGETEEC